MDTLSAKKISLAKKILDIEDSAVLESLEAFLAETEIAAYTTQNTPLSSKQYADHLEKISDSVTQGARTFTSEEVRSFVVNRNK